MRYLVASTFICVCLFVFTVNTFGQSCSGGQRYGIYFTDCFPLYTGETDDTLRLRRAITAAQGKLIFNETNYSISGHLELHSYLILEGIGNNPTYPSAFTTTRIIQTTSGESIFLIGDTDQEISIRDLALAGTSFPASKKTDCDKTPVDCPRTNIGIHAYGNGSSLFFQFSNLRFENFDKGIFVEPIDEKLPWQFDNVRLDHSTFINCNIGVHVNSMNSGWNITSIDMLVPEQYKEGPETMGFFFERSTYTSLNLVIGNGPYPLSSTPTPTAGTFIKIIRHGNISIQNAVSESFTSDLVIEGVNSTTKNFPVALINNHFMNGVSIKDSTVTSTGNQFGYYDSTAGINKVAFADVTGDSVIYSFGDKFCFEGQTPCTIGSVDYSKYRLTGSSKYGHNTFTSDTAGDGFTFNGNYSPFTINDSNLRFGNGTITLGSTVFVNMGLGTTTNGTMYYCSDCQATNPCTSGGSGAISKRINGAWVCN
ncbi:MAG TPA: hypothetical protein VGC76_12470 [Pyrinomonadaceae bacterium]|jgi:hypothetical protein